MSDDELGRIRGDLAVIQRAMGLHLSFGRGMLAFGITGLGGAEENRIFLVFWCAVVVGITVLNKWAAFSEKGSLGTFVYRDDEAVARDDAERDRPQPFL